MGLQSFSKCPSCKRQIDIAKSQAGIFTCPVCSSQFKHNLIKWIVAIPLAVIIAIVEYYYVQRFQIGIVAVWSSIGIVAAIVKFMPDYLVVRKGMAASEIPLSLRALPEPVKKESKRFTVLFVILVILFLCGLAWVAVVFS